MNISEFLAMGGYAFYVWGAYLVTAVAITIELVSLRARVRAARQHVDMGPDVLGARR